MRGKRILKDEPSEIVDLRVSAPEREGTYLVGREGIGLTEDLVARRRRLVEYIHQKVKITCK